ncbi:hypothetical protein P6709_10520 [Jeotgalibacillus sp. ET6]|uniref:hypothetical protein n=1 Tax=Jeotgalibacillus sp. ET6 TaxID=3037260 RepID=UPI0024189908|nr:hypothetical protein [Jeotgalibacillus sp. ET6]MDG5472186.1 hypothetical protein [Jeotgalibacillus sp. ET6]
MLRIQFERLVTISAICILSGFILIFASTPWGIRIGDFPSDIEINGYITSFLVAGGLIASFGLLIAAYLLIHCPYMPEREEEE